MAAAVIEAHDEIEFSCPDKHHFLSDLSLSRHVVITSMARIRSSVSFSVVYLSLG